MTTINSLNYKIIYYYLFFKILMILLFILTLLFPLDSIAIIFSAGNLQVNSCKKRQKATKQTENQ